VSDVTELKPHEKCSCSRHRKCALHSQAARRMARVAKPMHDEKKVAEGIERLRAMYGKDVER
jgi:hypothetical protein